MSTESFSYCWVKISPKVDMPAPSAVATDTQARMAVIERLAQSVAALPPCGKARVDLHMTVAHKPPSVAVKRPLPRGVHECEDHGIARLFAEPKFHGSWHIDDTYNGDTEVNQTLDVMHVIGTREDAVNWIFCDAGQKWLNGSLNHFLIGFGMPIVAAEDASPKDDGGSTPAATKPSLDTAQADDCASWAVAGETPPAAQAAAQAGPCTYPDADWGEQYLAFLKPPERLLLPADWRKLVKIEPPGAAEDECEAVVAMSALRSTREREIRRTAEGKDATLPVKQVLLNLSSGGKPKLERLIAVIIENVRFPLFTLKQEFKRGRPKNCCEKVTAMFDNEPLDPTHPAYPGGHATYAHSVAIVLSRLFPTLAGEFDAGARRSAENRVIAGLHYPSDSAAGEELARQLVDLLEQNEEFNRRVADVAQEWKQIVAAPAPAPSPGGQPAVQPSA